MELKSPSVPLHDSEFQRDAVSKAQKIGAPWVALWNMTAFQLHKTPDPQRMDRRPDDFVVKIRTMDVLTYVNDMLYHAL